MVSNKRKREPIDAYNGTEEEEEESKWSHEIWKDPESIDWKIQPDPLLNTSIKKYRSPAYDMHPHLMPHQHFYIMPDLLEHIPIVLVNMVRMYCGSCNWTLDEHKYALNRFLKPYKDEPGINDINNAVDWMHQNNILASERRRQYPIGFVTNEHLELERQIHEQSIDVPEVHSSIAHRTFNWLESICNPNAPEKEWSLRCGNPGDAWLCIRAEGITVNATIHRIVQDDRRNGIMSTNASLAASAALTKLCCRCTINRDTSSIITCLTLRDCHIVYYCASNKLCIT